MSINTENRRLEGKVALITGGARGQGASEARLFARHGAEVHLTDVLEAEGKAVAEETGGTFHYHDVTSRDAWERVVSEIRTQSGRCDVVVNNAGVFRLIPMTATTDDLWDQMVAVNQTGVFLGMQTTAPLLEASGGGSIINISSIAGLRAAATSFAYSATKWAVRGMTKSAAVELAPLGIRVNSIHPGIIDTAMLGEFDQVIDRQTLLERIPAHRIAEPEEIANLALFLASDESSYCTGSEFVADGGYTA